MRKRWDGNETVGIVGFDFCYGWRVIQLVSRHVIEVQEIGFKSLVRSSGEVGLQQILAGNVITCLEPLIN